MAGGVASRGVVVVGLSFFLGVGCGRAKVASDDMDGGGGSGAGGAAGAPSDGDAMKTAPGSDASINPDEGDLDGGTLEPCTGGLSLALLCSGYCNDVSHACPGLFADFDACAALCTAPTWSCGTFGDTSGNTLQCRITYGRQAATSSDAAATACPKASPNSPACL